MGAWRVKPVLWAMAVALFTMLTVPTARAAPEPRLALVIGNGGYESLGRLDNPVNDARLIADTLQGLGFQVMVHLDADQRAMKRAIQAFGRALDEAGESAVGFFYYAGHAVQVGGVNYLIPTAAAIGAEPDLQIEAVRADWILGQMEYARNRLNIVVLDACRNNPFARGFRSATRGLARMEAPSGAVIAYATAPGDVAADGTGDSNSPYAQALAATLAEPGLDVLQVFNRVGLTVHQRTGGQQEPWLSTSPVPDFVFRPANRDDPEAAYWARIAELDDPAVFRAYPLLFPEGAHAEQARARLAALEAARATAADERAAAERDRVAAMEARVREYEERISALASERESEVAALKQALEAERKEAAPAVRRAEEEAAAAPQRAESEVASLATGPAAAAERSYTTAELRAADGWLTAAQRRAIQTELRTLGHYASGVDGVFGPGTRAAISAYQVALGAAGTGFLTPEQGDRLLTPAVGMYPRRPETFRDCDVCPEMVRIPAGSFTMGSSEEERKWAISQGANLESLVLEGPRREVRIGPGLSVGRYEVTRGEYAAFARATGRDDGDGCYVFESGWKTEATRSWRDPGYAQTDDHPAVCVTWEDAHAYAAWLGGQTGKHYRLLSESEWEYAARAGTTSSRYWGDDRKNRDACEFENVASVGDTWKHHFTCKDGFKFAAPAGRYRANVFGLSDMLGNVWEWVEDCYVDSYAGAPTDGSARSTLGCEYRVIRGGSWFVYPWRVRAANRSNLGPDNRGSDLGFRLARID